MKKPYRIGLALGAVVATASLCFAGAALADPLTGYPGPVANNDTATTTPETTVAIAVLANDVAGSSATALAPASLTITTEPMHGTAGPFQGAIHYTPAFLFSGTDTIGYQICDNQTPSLCASGTVTITVASTTVPTPTENEYPLAVDDAAEVIAGQAVAIAILANDTAPVGFAVDPATATILTNPAHGTASLDSSGTVIYTAQAGYSGADSFTYQVCDTQVTDPRRCDDATVNVSILAAETPTPVPTTPAATTTKTPVPTTPASTTPAPTTTAASTSAPLPPNTGTGTAADSNSVLTPALAVAAALLLAGAAGVSVAARRRR